MAAVTTELLSLEEFRSRYTGSKPYFEYWNGEPVQKAMPTSLHSSVQVLVIVMLREAGYKALSEPELRIDPNWQPVPDVVGTVRVEQPYLTEPVDVVVEILSPEDRMSRVKTKCHKYSQLGIKQILVIDPQLRFGLNWNSQTGQLIEVESVLLPNGNTLALDELWSRLDIELQ